MAGCKHKNAEHLFAGDSFVDNRGVLLWPECEQLRCLDCGAWLPLGPANDVGCFAEIEAARLLAAVRVGDDASIMEWQTAIGCAAHDADNDPPEHSALVELWHAGWLARAAWTHGDG